MNTLHNAIKSFWNDEDGLEMVEYAVIAALIIVAATTAFTTVGTNISTTISGIAGKI
jgi:pilus assembly protein Flp/PilA